MSEAIEEVIFPALGLVFLLLGIVLIVSILFTAFSPYDQIAFANAERLSATLNRACLNPGDTINLNSLELQQNVPSFTWAFTIIPRWMIRMNGDPNYLLYYESFPPGDATGWEVYQDFQNRIVVPLPDQVDGKQTDGLSGTEVGKYACELLKSYQLNNQNQKVDGLIFNNIVLSEKFRSEFILKSSPLPKDNSGSGIGGGGSAGGAGSSGSFGVDVSDCLWEVGGPLAGDPSGTQKFFSFGKWQDQGITTALPGEGKNQFIFSNYAGLTNLEKAAIKYEPCGANSLCLKTRSGVYTFPLDQCKGQIKGVHLFYDARQRAFVWGVAGVTVAAIAAGSIYWMTASGASAAAVAAGEAIPATAIPIAPGVYAATTAGGETVGILATGGTVTGTMEAGAAAGTSGGIFSTVFSKAGSMLLKILPWKTAAAYLGYKAVKFMETAMLGYKTADFSLASPCSLTKAGADDVVTVKSMACENLDGKCKNLISYHLYKYNADSGKLIIDSYKDSSGRDVPYLHYACAEKANNMYGTYAPANTYVGTDQCLEVHVNVKNENFCWTKDPYESGGSADTQGIADFLGFNPVVKSLSYIPFSTASGTTQGFVLAPSDISSLNKFSDTVERAFSWGWP